MSSGVYNFTASIQLKILTLLWKDEPAYTFYSSVIKPKYFSKSIYVDICRILMDYKTKYKVAPSPEALLEEVNDLCLSSKTKKKLLPDYEQAVTQMNQYNLSDIDYIKDKITSFGKKQALIDAIMEGADIIEKQGEDKYSKIEVLVRDALRVGEDLDDLGTGIYDDVYEVFTSYGEKDDVIERIPTGMTELDKRLGGGVGRTEMCIIVAPPGRGKTTCLVSMGGNAVRSGYKVVHISLENNEKQVLRNYHTRVLGKNTEYIGENVESSVRAMGNIRKYYGGELVVKKYPPKAVTVQGIKNYLDQLKVAWGFEPDVVIVDYGALLKPASIYSDKRNNIEENYEDLRAIADEYNCAVYSAAQGNRGSLAKKVVTMADLAECFAIGNTADVMLALCQTNKEKQQGIMRGFIAKNRDNQDGIILKGKISYDTKKIDYFEEVFEEDEKDDDEEGEEEWE